MGKPYDFSYSMTGNSSHGEMICSTCHKPIESGVAYRSHKKNKNGDWGYITNHKTCCENDPEWERIKQRNCQAEIRSNKIEAELRAFIIKHGIEDGDELVDWVESAFDIDARNY